MSLEKLNQGTKINLKPPNGKYDFGKFVEKRPGCFEYFYLKYQACPCKEKYYLKPSSRLSKYLYKCKGWVPDETNTYSLNFILIVLLANWRSCTLLYRCSSTYYSYLYVNHSDEELCKIFGKPYYNDGIIYKHSVSDIRKTIAKKYFKIRENIPHTEAPLLCTYGLESLTYSICDSRHSGYSPDDVQIYICKKPHDSEDLDYHPAVFY